MACQAPTLCLCSDILHDSTEFRHIIFFLWSHRRASYYESSELESRVCLRRSRRPRRRRRRHETGNGKHIGFDIIVWRKTCRGARPEAKFEKKGWQVSFWVYHKKRILFLDVIEGHVHSCFKTCHMLFYSTFDYTLQRKKQILCHNRTQLSQRCLFHVRQKLLCATVASKPGMRTSTVLVFVREIARLICTKLKAEIIFFFKTQFVISILKWYEDIAGLLYSAGAVNRTHVEWHRCLTKQYYKNRCYKDYPLITMFAVCAADRRVNYAHVVKQEIFVDAVILGRSS